MQRWVRWAVVTLALVGHDITINKAMAYEQPTGTFSAGVQGQVSGLFSGSGVEYGLFELDGLDGVRAGVAVRLRMAIDRQSAFGISFETLGFDRTGAEIAAFEEAARDTAQTMHAAVVTGEYYRYFARKAKDTPYVVAGLGWFRPEIRFGDFATRFPGSGLTLTFGGGLEHFFSRTVSLELSVRSHALFHDEGTSSSAEASLGLRFYHLTRRRR